jgi:PncC family amidohydrolase
MNRESKKKVRRILRVLQEKNLTVATAESCTGGGIAAALTSVSGSSAHVKGGVVAYWNEIKHSVLHVSLRTLAHYGTVSEEVVLEMASGAVKAFRTDIAVSTSGVTGPTGGTPENPVCTVWMAVVSADGHSLTFRMSKEDQGRMTNTRKAIDKALDLLLKFIENIEN